MGNAEGQVGAQRWETLTLWVTSVSHWMTRDDYPQFCVRAPGWMW